MAKPSFINLWNAYSKLLEDYPDKHPCDGPWDNQCAIRMSIVLNSEMTLTVNAKTYSEPRCAHGHARGAESLANWLYRKIGKPKVYAEGAKAKLAVGEDTGIIFFKDCFTRAGEKRAVGDHIDLWNKGLVQTYSDPSNKAAQVWFWALK